MMRGGLPSSYLLLQLGLDALAVPELASRGLRLPKRKGEEERSSLVEWPRRRCVAFAPLQGRREGMEGKGESSATITFPESMKYFAGTISASLSRKRLQLTVSVAAMLPALSFCFVCALLKLGRSRLYVTPRRPSRTDSPPLWFALVPCPRSLALRARAMATSLQFLLQRRRPSQNENSVSRRINPREGKDGVIAFSSERDVSGPRDRGWGPVQPALAPGRAAS